jgi:hypothetical protein
MPDVIVRPGAPDEYTIPFTHGWELREIVGRMRRLRIEVDRAEAKAANLNPKNDKIELSGVDTVRLTDVQTGTETWTLQGYSAEWDANRAGFTPGGDLREGDDQTLITNLVGEVSSWSAGTINSFTGPLSFVFSHAHRHEALRRIEKNVPGELKFRDFGTVDYVDRLGTDKSGSVTLSDTNANIEEEITITERGRELDGTHIRVLGAHEGEAQLFVNLVPSGDSGNYDNEVTYSSPRWSDSGDTDWDRWSNQDITDQATLEEEAAALAEELKETLVKAEATVATSVGLEVGDTVRVVKDDADLDREMRVHKKWRRAGTMTDVGGGATVVDKVMLSTRTTLQTDDDADLEEIRKFNTGFQGSSVAVNGGPVIGAVDSANPLTFGFRYPDLEFENTATLRVRGESYRVDSQPKSHSHDVDIDIPDHDHDVDIFTTTPNAAPDSDATTPLSLLSSGDIVDTIDYEFVDGDGAVGLPYATLSNSADVSSGPIDFTIENTTQNRTLISESGFTLAPYDTRIFMTADVGGNIEGDSVEFNMQSGGPNDISMSHGLTVLSDHSHTIDETETSDDGGAFFTTETSSTAVGQEPGIFTTADTPSNVGVEINGTTVATGIGTGTFETTVDIAGELTNDAWNDITLTSDSLGRIQATVFIEGYDQVGMQ